MLAKQNTQAAPSVSSKYVHINTMDVHTVLKDNGFYESGYKQARVRQTQEGYQKHMSIFRRADLDDGAHGNFNVLLLNGHNGGTAIRLELGYFRLLCENQLINAQVGFKMAHRGDDLLNRLNAGIPMLLKAYEDFRALKERLQLVTFEPEQTQALIDTALSIRGVDGALVENETIKGQILTYNRDAMNYTRRVADRGAGAWEVLNRIQENVIKGTTWSFMRGNDSGDIAHRKLRAVTGLDRVVSYNKELTARAVELAGVA